MDKKLISILLPVYNEEGNIETVYQRIKEVLKKIPLDHEILFIDDGSKDRSWSIVERLARQDPAVRALALSRNFGQQIALSAGIDMAKGDALITMDADLQHPPEMILEFIKKWDEGFDIIYAVRQNAEDASLAQRVTSSVFYTVFNRISRVEIPKGVANFHLMTKDVADQVRNCRERVRYLAGLISWTGFRTIGIPYQADIRHSGKTKNTFFYRLNMALGCVTSFSSSPLYFSSVLGAVISLAAFIYILFILYIKLFTTTLVPGWASLLIAVLFLGGVQLLSIGILGEYLGRVYEEVKQRPLYLVKKQINTAEKNAS